MIERESHPSRPSSTPVETRRDSITNAISSSVPGQSVIQIWERSEDVQLTQPHVDLMDNWSSDGDSVSSSSSGSADNTLSTSREGNHSLVENEHQRIVARTNVNLLKRARIFTTEEAIDQAIDRWQTYILSCSEALEVLRQQLIDAYVPYAVEKWNLDHQASNKTSSSHSIRECIDSSSHSQAPLTLRKSKALRNMLRHSVKVANQRHLACVSKFALVSNRIAKWRKPTASQRCRYRDPTTTTWERPCGNLCLPLLPVCAAHVVQLKPAPYVGCSNDKSVVVINGCQGSAPTLETKPLDASPGIPTDSGSTGSDQVAWIQSDASVLPPPARSTRSVKPPPSESLTISPPSTITPALQLPTQYLFRPCGGSFGQPCNKPVVAWNPHTRCPRHTFMVATSEETPLNVDEISKTQDLHAVLCKAVQSKHYKQEPEGS